uniref:Phosphatidylethanolamine-binding protein 4 n=1 Tax=Callorhinchus milii TaxID=7868 RepID=V9LIN3_CALMI
MNWLSFLFLAGLGCLAYQKTDVEDSICIVQNITGQDNNICSGDLEIIYPELGNVACSIILRCLEYQRKLSREWGPPSVKSFQVDQPCGQKWGLTHRITGIVAAEGVHGTGGMQDSI